MLAAFTADLTRVVAARGRAQAAADAAALAGAQELVVSSGRSPEEVAAEYAERGGAWLESCQCDPSADEVVVSVALDVHLPLLGQVRIVRARARAVAEAPAGTPRGFTSGRKGSQADRDLVGVFFRLWGLRLVYPSARETDRR